MSYDLVELATAVKPLAAEGAARGVRAGRLPGPRHLRDIPDGRAVTCAGRLRRRHPPHAALPATPAPRCGDRRRPHAPRRGQQPRLLRRRPAGRRLPRLVVGPSAHGVSLRPPGRSVRRPEVDGHRQLPLRGHAPFAMPATTSASPTWPSAPSPRTATATSSPRPASGFGCSTSTRSTRTRPRSSPCATGTPPTTSCRTTASCCSCARSTPAPCRLRAAPSDAPPYPYAVDTRGRRISRQLRRAYRRDSLPSGRPLPSPFDPSDATA